MFSLLDVLFFFLPGRSHHHKYGIGEDFGCVASPEETDDQFRFFSFLFGLLLVVATLVALCYFFVPNFHIPLLERLLPNINSK